MEKLQVRRRRRVSEVEAEPVSNSKRKKSVRLMMQKYKNKLHSKAKKHYTWPRTVEAAKDPFADASGKNKMFYVIACNLFPESKIVQPSDSESDCEQENLSNNEDGEQSNGAGFYNGNGSPVLQKRPRRHYSRTPRTNKRIGYGRAKEMDLSWRSQYNRRVPHRRSRESRSRRIVDHSVILDVINTVVARYKLADGNGNGSVENPPPTVEKIPFPSSRYIPEEPEEEEEEEEEDSDDVEVEDEETNEEENDALDESHDSESEDDDDDEEDSSDEGMEDGLGLGLDESPCTLG